MEIQVYDTYVKAKDGKTMHFDVYLDKAAGSMGKALEGAKKYLSSVGEGDAKITTEECRFCHVKDPSQEEQTEITKEGFYIYKMSNCL